MDVVTDRKLPPLKNLDQPANLVQVESVKACLRVLKQVGGGMTLKKACNKENITQQRFWEIRRVNKNVKETHEAVLRNLAPWLIEKIKEVADGVDEENLKVAKEKGKMYLDLLKTLGADKGLELKAAKVSLNIMAAPNDKYDKKNIVHDPQNQPEVKKEVKNVLTPEQIRAQTPQKLVDY